MADLHKAVEFVRQNGTPVEAARLEYLLTGSLPSSRIVSEWGFGQRSDGGFAPFWAKDASSVDQPV